MNLRFWGGWFLVIMVLGIVLTMGCEKGALGVKSATVTGKVVDRDNPSIPIKNAIVHMMSHSPTGDSPLVQGPTYTNATTNSDGVFVFENVTPDNVVFEIEANGYSKIQYPQVTADSTASSTLAAQVQDVYVRSGSVTDLGPLTMKKIANPLPSSKITAKIVLRDAISKEILDSSKVGNITISFNNQTVESTVSGWQNGTDSTGNTISLDAESSYNVTVQANPQYYLTYTTTISGGGNIQAEFLLTPVTYNLLLRCTNVPDYIEGGVVNVFAELPSANNKPPKILATQTISNLGSLTTPNLPALITVPGLALPIDLRVQVRGYEDEVVRIDQNNLPSGTQGNYRVDVNFLATNSTREFTYDPVLASQACLLDNRITRDVSFVVAGKDLKSNDVVTGNISLPYDHVEYYNGIAVSNISVNNQPVSVTFVDTVVGYRMNWGITVSPGPTSVAYASGSYTITSGDNGDMVDVPSDNPTTGLVYGANAVRPTGS